MTIDQTNDPGFGTLCAVTKRFPALEEMAKTAELGAEEFKDLPNTAFAWETRRKFPIHSKEHTAISLGYRKVASAVPAEVDDKLTKAAAAYGIDTQVFDTPEQVKVASEEFFLLGGRFRVTSKDEVKYAENALLRKYATLSPQDRAEAFINLGKVAEHFEVPLQPSTQKLAGFTITSTKVMKDWIEARKMAAENLKSTVVGAYEKLARAYDRVDPYITDRSVQLKLAALIDELDQESGVHQFYGKSMLTPLETVFNTDKVATGQIMIGSLMLDKDKLAALPMSFWESLLGDDVAKEIATDGEPDIDKLAPILPTLPQDLTIVAQKQLAHLA